jgi:hypothetical protein
MDRITSIFPTAYFPSIDYLNVFFEQSNSVIEIQESFPKQTIRNRCEILTSNGIHRLSVPVTKINGSKTLTKDIGIDYSKKWQNEHWRAIQSAYASSPYFEDYGFRVKEIIYNCPESLTKLNLVILKFIFEILDLNPEINLSEKYKIDYDLDFRNTDFMIRQPIDNYQQVFSYDKEFTSNLSFLDLLFNEGPFMRKWILKK